MISVNRGHGFVYLYIFSLIFVTSHELPNERHKLGVYCSVRAGAMPCLLARTRPPDIYRFDTTVCH